MNDQRRGGFNLDDYVTVAERIAAFYAKFPDGSLQSEIVELNDHLVVMRAYAYRTAEDPRPGIGYSSLGIPGTTPYTRGSEVENCESSCWGRAIAALGFEVKRGIASREEVQNKAGESPKQDGGVISTKEHPIDTTRTPENGLIGTAIAQGTQDFELRQSPDGWTLPFRIKNGTTSFIVVAENEMAQALATIKDTIVDQRVTVWGHWTDEVIPKKGSKPEIRYRILHLERMATPDGIIPAPAWDSEPDPTVEPESLPLFDEDEQAKIDAALAKVPA